MDLRAPQSDAQAVGQDVDDNFVQPYLRSGTIVEGKWTELLEKLIPLLPEPGPREGLLVQAPMRAATYDGGPECVGYADWIEVPGDGWVHVGDLKTTSDLRYAKGEDQIRDATQMVAYAAAAWAMDGVEGVSVYHVTGQRKGRPRTTRIPGRIPGGDPLRGSVMERGWVDDRWGERVEVVRLMQAAVDHCSRSDDLVPSTDECEHPAWGKCHHYAACHAGGAMTSWPRWGKREDAMSDDGASDLIKRLNEAKARKVSPEEAIERAARKPPQPDPLEEARRMVREDALRPAGGGRVFLREGKGPGYLLVEPTPAQAQAMAEAFAQAPPKAEGPPATVVPIRPEAVAIDPSQVVPPDAPSRTSTPEQVAAAEAGARKRGRPRKEKPVEAPKVRLAPNADVVYGDVGVSDEEIKKAIDEVEVVDGVTVSTETHEDLGDPKGLDVGTSPIRQLSKAGRKAPLVPPVLYVDCQPMKHDGKPPVLLEDWLGPIMDLAAEAYGVPDVRLIDYKSKGVLATAVQEAIESCPAALVIDSDQFGADVVLAALVPHSPLVVRGRR